jgi:hypothetical protein
MLRPEGRFCDATACEHRGFLRCAGWPRLLVNLGSRRLQEGAHSTQTKSTPTDLPCSHQRAEGSSCHGDDSISPVNLWRLRRPGFLNLGHPGSLLPHSIPSKPATRSGPTFPAPCRTAGRASGGNRRCLAWSFRGFLRCAPATRCFVICEGNWCVCGIP